MKKKLLYIEIYQTLKSRILSSQKLYRLPSERSLAEEFQASRVTIRHALKLLSDDQIIEKKACSASFITPNIFRHDLLQAKSLKEEFQTLNKKYSIDILSFDLIPATPYVAEFLGIENNQLVYFVNRVISSEGVPLIYEESFLPQYLFPNMTKSDTLVKYDYIEQDMGMSINCVHKKLTAKIPATHIKKLLNITNQSTLYFELYAELTNGVVCEYVQQYYHPQYVFMISSYRH